MSDQIISNFLSMLEQGQDNALIRFSLGNAYLNSNNYEEAIKHLVNSVRTLNLNITTEARDVITNPPEENSFDVIVVSHFLDRQIMPDIISALRKGGLLFYQTFTKAHVQETGPSNEKYRLDKNELLNLCKELDVVVYREEDLIGDTASGFRNEALFIGQCK